MQESIHLKYKDLKLSEEIQSLYMDLLNQDNLNKKVLKTIAIGVQNHNAFTVSQLAEQIEAPRLVGERDSKTRTLKFNVKETSIDRKATAKILDRLSYMGLIYFTYELPYKRVMITKRGVQILKVLSVENKN
ncbi:hypothetical protein [Psychrobacillus sp. FSL H8-0487]|uniref:hypothetical protein n=1 Tax=Psychrobacillus sp. FSL H8-0487 TaxID=2921391 RepID=UPI0030F7DB42